MIAQYERMAAAHDHGAQVRMKEPPKPKAAPGKPQPSPEFKEFYMRLVPAAMNYAVRNAQFDIARHATQEVAWTFWTAGVKGAQAAAELTGPPAAVLHAMLRTEIVAEWRRIRGKPNMAQRRGAREARKLSKAAADVRRTVILMNMSMGAVFAGGESLSGLSEAELDALPLDPAVAEITDYLSHHLRAEKNAEIEARLERDPDFFEHVAPVVMSWQLPTTPQPRNDENWVAPRNVADKSVQADTPERGEPGVTRLWWRDYHMPERGVEFMWQRFCEMAGRP
jgi:hypothetical protein